jgi:hypothetical protein
MWGDIGQAADSFVSGLTAEKERRRQAAAEQALLSLKQDEALRQQEELGMRKDAFATTLDEQTRQRTNQKQTADALRARFREQVPEIDQMADPDVIEQFGPAVRLPSPRDVAGYEAAFGRATATREATNANSRDARDMTTLRAIWSRWMTDGEKKVQSKLQNAAMERALSWRSAVSNPTPEQSEAARAVIMSNDPDSWKIVAALDPKFAQRADSIANADLTSYLTTSKEFGLLSPALQSQLRRASSEDLKSMMAGLEAVGAKEQGGATGDATPAPEGNYGGESLPSSPVDSLIFESLKQLQESQKLLDSLRGDTLPQR